MNISSLLGTFASSLLFYISEFERIILHVSGNLPLVSNQIDGHVKEAEKHLDPKIGDFFEFSELLDNMLSVKKPIYEILVELQRQDIIQQQMNHLFNAVEDVQKIIDDSSENNDVHFLTLLNFLLHSIEKQMARINKELLDLVETMEQKFSDMHSKISLIHKDEMTIVTNKKQLEETIQSILNITENLSNELKQYNNFFIRLRLLQDDMKREIEICSNLKISVGDDLKKLGGALSLKECRFTSTVIQKIVDKLSVEEERETLKEEFSELKIEDSADNDVVFF